MTRPERTTRARRDHAVAEQAESPHALRQFIGGQWREGTGKPFTDVNPTFPDEVVATGQLAERPDLKEAVHAARGAFPRWATTPHPARGQILARAADIIDAKADQWGIELSREEGKTRAEGVGEVRRAAEIFRYFAAEGTRATGEIFASPRPGEQIQVIRRPIGTVAVITPFNFPIAIPAWKIAPALTYGNTVVWKPAGSVPLLAVRLTEALHEAGLPDGVLSLLLADGTLAGELVEHPDIDAVTFTGSTTIGRRLIAACGRLARPIQTEMGGKNAAAVLNDADLALAADQVLAGAFGSTGQKCTATSRLILADKIADDFLAMLVERTNAFVVGDPLDPGVQMGPLISDDARTEIQQVVEAAATREHVQVIAGGGVYSDDLRKNGAFIAPTVLELAGDDVLWREELFGPVLSVRRVDDDRAALDLINDSPFGLSAAVFTDNLRAVSTAMEHVDVGVLHINSETTGADPHVPFGGVKESAYGPKEQGRAAREFFTTSKTVYVRDSTGGL